MANLCVTNTGYEKAESERFFGLKTAAGIKSAAAVAQILLNLDSAINNYKKLRDITSQGITLEEDQFNHVKDTYWPAEEQMLNEFTQKTPWESQAVLAKRYAGRMWAPFAAQFAKQQHKLECEKPRYCGTAFKRKMEEMLAQRCALRTNVNLMADRIAFYEIEAVKETDFERRKAVIAMRQGLIGQATSLMAQTAAGYGGAQAAAVGAINNAIQTLGYNYGQYQNAQNRVGADPWFHARVGQSFGTEEAAPQQQTAFPQGNTSDYGALYTAGIGNTVTTPDATFVGGPEITPLMEDTSPAPTLNGEYL